MGVALLLGEPGGDVGACRVVCGVPRSGRGGPRARNRGARRPRGPRRPRASSGGAGDVGRGRGPAARECPRARGPPGGPPGGHGRGPDALATRARRRSRLFRYGERVRVSPPRRSRDASAQPPPPASARATSSRRSVVGRPRATRTFATHATDAPFRAPSIPADPHPDLASAPARVQPRCSPGFHPADEIARGWEALRGPLAALFLDEPAPRVQRQVAAMANKSNRHARHARAGTLPPHSPARRRAAASRPVGSGPDSRVLLRRRRRRGRPRGDGGEGRRVVQGPVDDAGGVGRRRRRGRVARRSTRARRHPVRRRGLARRRGRSRRWRWSW